MSDSSTIQTVTVVEILPTKVWIESGMFGERYVVLQHEGWDPFDYAVFNYRYGYTDNASTWGAAHQLAIALGATEPVENRQRLPPGMVGIRDLGRTKE